MNLRASFCNPFNPEIIELGSIEKDKVLKTFDKIPWDQFLEDMKLKNENEIYWSPSLEIENTDNRNGISVSPVDGKEWYIFYKRPKLIKRFFGLFIKMDNNHLSQITGQTKSDAQECLEALINNNLEFLENKINS